MKDLNCVITGGAGFIGSHIAEQLLNQGASKVTIIDNLSTGKMENIKHLDQDRIEFVKGNITELGLKKIFENNDYIFHEAAVASVPESITHPTKTNNINITGSLEILKAACEVEVKKVVSASSSAVYGETKKLPNSEDLPLNPLTPYAVTKATLELYSNAFTSTYNLPTACLRYFNVFGPRQDAESEYSAVIPKFINALLNDEQPIINGDGEQTRDFINVKNVADANIKMAESDVTGVYNIAHGVSTSIKELLEMICDIMGYDFNPLYREKQKGDIVHSVADISKAKNVINFESEHNFKNELKETIDYFTKEYENKQ
jgi:UDP-glucose 4-epimerase